LGACWLIKRVFTAPVGGSSRCLFPTITNIVSNRRSCGERPHSGSSPSSHTIRPHRQRNFTEVASAGK
jgi:hypothetical protein